jgi:hypothetical protein
MNPRVVSESATEPIDIDEAAENLRAPDDGGDSYLEVSLIGRLIRASRQLCEEETELSLVAKTLELTLDSFCPTRISADAKRSHASVERTLHRAPERTRARNRLGELHRQRRR